MFENKYIEINKSENLDNVNKKEKIFEDIFSELGLHNSDIPIEGNVRQGMIGNTDVVLLQDDDNSLIVESLRTKDKFRGQGSAGIALDKIIEVTEKRNIILKAIILPQNSINKGLDSDNLRKFCEKRGFIFNEKNECIRIPNYSLN